MWYFSWILGTGLAIAFAVLNAMWYEVLENYPGGSRKIQPLPSGSLNIE